MRGLAITKALKKAGFDAQYINNDQLNDVQIDDDTIGIIVKIPYLDTIKHLRNCNAEIVFDPIDNWKWGNLQFGYDIILANNKVHARQLARFFNGKIVIIPHLHTNINRLRKKTSIIKMIGYIGSPKQFGMTEEMKTYCAENDLEWFQTSSDNTEIVNEVTQKLDIGVIYLDKSMERFGLNYNNVVTYKPATKLINVLSFGIPCLFTPTVAFMEVVDMDKALDFLVVRSKKEVYEKINALKDDASLYQNLADRCAAVSEYFHTDNAVEYYINRLRSYS